MILAWRDNETHRVEARVRSAEGVLGRPRILTHDLGLNTDPTARGVVAWADSERRARVIRLAQATDDGHFPAAQTIARERSDLDPAFAAAGPAVSVVASPPFERRHPIHWQRVAVPSRA
jgi:hypothetical protein